MMNLIKCTRCKNQFNNYNNMFKNRNMNNQIFYYTNETFETNPYCSKCYIDEILNNSQIKKKFDAMINTYNLSCQESDKVIKELSHNLEHVKKDHLMMNNVMHEKFESVNGELLTTKTENARLNDDVAMLRSEITRCNVKMISSRSEILRLKKDVSKKSAFIERIRKEYINKSRDVRMHLSTIDKLTSKNDVLSYEIKDYVDKIDLLGQNIEEYVKKIDDLNGDVLGLTLSKGMIQQDLDDKVKNCEILKGYYENSVKELRDQKQVISDGLNMIEDLSVSLNKSIIVNHDLKEKIENMKIMHSNDVDRLNGDIVEITKKCEKRLGEQIVENNLVVDKLKLQNDDLMVELKRKVCVNHNLVDQHNKDVDVIHKLKMQCDEKIHEYSNILSDNFKMKQQLKSNVIEHMTKISNLEDVLRDKNKLCNEYVDEIKGKDVVICELRDKLQNNKSYIEAIECSMVQNASVMCENDRLKELVANLGNKCDDMCLERDNYANCVGEYQNQVESLNEKLRER